MLRFLLAMSILCAMGSAGIGFLNRSKLTLLNKQLADSRAAGDRAQTQIGDFQQKLKQTQDRLTTQEQLTKQERDTRSSDLETTQNKLTQATEQLAAKDGENKALTAALTEAGRNLEQKQRAEDDRRALVQRLIHVEDRFNQLSRTSGNQTVPEGSVLSINREAKALTISLGSDVGLQANSRLMVMRNGEAVAQLRVVSVETNSCVAEFASASPENFARVVVGDQVTVATK
ncbi:MAG: hypothetical protein JOY96_11090 [Verrucomicrobia bacterium]|nr:hypothetical protein [Verrucomicrobiota bacterium]MBV9673424.1 hypothetical protein [Verrucomicrobiota bacterium]